MTTFRHQLDRFLGGAICVLMGGMVLNVLWQVFTRFVLRQPSSFTEELARYMMIWVGLLGSAYASGRKSHLALDLITAHLHGSRKRVSELIIHTAVLVFSLTVMLGGGGRLVWIQLSLGQQSAALQIKLGYVYLAVPLAGACIVFYSLHSLVETLRDRAGANPPADGGRLT